MRISLIVLLSVVFLFIIGFLDVACKKEAPSQPCAGAPPETTSHNFLWEIDSVGGAASSSWYDIAIINDSLAYAVGDVYLYDSLGNVDPQPYNLAKWDGRSWSLRKVVYHYQGQSFISPLQSVFAFSANDVWVCGNGVFHSNGDQFDYNSIPIPTVWGPYQMNKIWGTADNDLFIVGEHGSIAHFDGSSWQKVSSPTTVDLLDIWGTVNPQNGERTILAIGSDRGGYAYSLLQINGLTASSIDTAGLTYPQETSLWLSACGPYYVIGNGIFTKKRLTDSLWKDISNPSWPFVEKIRGNSPNDIFVVGDFGTVLHYNGATWKNYQSDGDLPPIDGNWYSVACKDNTVMAVGSIGNRAAMLRGVRK